MRGSLSPPTKSLNFWSPLNSYVIIVERFANSPIRNPCAGNNGRWIESIMTTVITIQT